MKHVYQRFKLSGSSAGATAELMPFPDLTQLMGFEEVWAFEKRYADPVDSQAQASTATRRPS
jgi:hypothetical protein